MGMKRIEDKTMKSALRAALVLAVSILLLAGAAPSLKRVGASAKPERLDPKLYQALLDLQNPWTVMCVAAHPDDEDGATLTVLRRKYGVHTVSLFSTYGEGGQNAIGPELYEELGAIRAHETEEAARIQGSEPYFLGLRDFGFSKSADEAFRVWGHDEALRRMVLKVRELRPDVIITNHDTTSGHGHHQATGRLVLEAFAAAADPARFPEQLRDGKLQAWQVKRLFVRFSFEGGAETKALEDEAERAGRVVTINRNERDPVRGTTYAEQALQALHKHATQGPWPQTLPPAGWPPVRYRLALEAKGAPPLPRNAETVLDNLSLPEETAKQLMPLAVKAVLPLYLSGNASRDMVLSALLSLKRSDVFLTHSGTKDSERFQRMRARLDYALAVAAGISAEFVPNGPALLIPETLYTSNAVLYNRGERDARIVRRSYLDNGEEIKIDASPELLKSGSSIRSPITFDVPLTTVINVPQSAHLYDGHLFGEELAEKFVVEVEGVPFEVEAAARFDVAPPVEIESVSPSPLVITPQTIDGLLPFTFRITNHLPEPLAGTVRASQLVNQGLTDDTWLRLQALGTIERKVPYSLSEKERREIKGRAGEFSRTERFVIEIPSPSRNGSMTSERDVKLVYTDARVTPGLRVGYVRSSDFTLPAALSALGVQSKELTIDEVRAGNLQAYDAIIIDNRGYQAHPELVQINRRLLDYALQGGTLIVFYHKTNEWNVDAKANRTESLSPYPIQLGNARVTDENAPVTFTNPRHPLLNFPNRITANDFKGWIQERGLYFPKEWDKRYSTLFVMNDPGESPLQGGLLAASYGRGRYIYTSIVWYRELRAGVPGAYRMLANMISYGRGGDRQSK